MYFLIRRQTGRSAAEALESEYQGDRLSLGEAPGTTVPLPGCGGDLQIEPRANGQVRISARGLELTHGGRGQRSLTLATGETFSVPGYTLTLVPAPQGFDCAVQISAAAVDTSQLVRKLGLAEPPSRTRLWSWLGATLVLLLFLAIPALVFLDPQTAQWLRSSPLPDDSLWSSGPLAAAHHTSGIATDCHACHETPFVMVRDSACLDCHRRIQEHADLAIYPPHDFAGERCASCHRDHNEPPMLVRRDKDLCVSCHRKPDSWLQPGRSQLASVSAFTESGHPSFRLTLLTPQGPGGAHGWDAERVRRSSGAQELEERSNLKFNHEVHLNPEKVRTADDSAALECASCHTLKADREHFEPIAMDQHCRSCHTLTFDIFEPDLELPHGDLRAAIVAMESHFIREFTDPELRQQRAGSKPRRVPNKRESAASCEGNGLDCGRAEALKEAEYQFANTGCITCHEVLDTGLASVFDRWYVQPVRLSEDWYTQARFDHVSHLTLRGVEGDAVCETCHAASLSSRSQDILIPDQDNCLGCHAEQRGGIAVDCVGCHSFHRGEGSLSVLVRSSPAVAIDPHHAVKGD